MGIAANAEALLLNCGGISRGTFVSKAGRSCLLRRLAIGGLFNVSFFSSRLGSSSLGASTFGVFPLLCLLFSSSSFGAYVSDFGIRTNRLSGLSSFSFGNGCAWSLAASAFEMSASSIIGTWSIIPRKGGSYEGFFERASRAKETTSSSTVGGGRRCLRTRLLLRSRGAS